MKWLSSVTPETSAGTLIAKSGKRSGPWIPYLLSLPALGLLGPFLVVPLLLVLTVSIGIGSAGSFRVESFTLSHYVEVLSDYYYLRAFLRTLAIGAFTVITTAAIGLPLAYWMLRHPKWRIPIIVALTGPLLINVIVRLYGWQLLLSDNGPVNQLLRFVFAWDAPLMFVGSTLGVFIVLIHVMLPYMTISIFNSLQAIETSIIEAAATLGASSWRVFWRILVPLSRPGLMAGSVIVFSLSAATFAIPAVMGGGKINTIPTLVYHESMAMNFPRATALAACLLIVLLPLARFSAKLEHVRR